MFCGMANVLSGQMSAFSVLRLNMRDGYIGRDDQPSDGYGAAIRYFIA